MPNTTKPTQYISWTQGSPTQVAQPTPTQQASGFTAGQRPTYQTLNWLLFTLDNWVQFFDQAIVGTSMSAAIDPLMRLIGGGTWSYNATTNALSWSDSIYLSVPGLPDSANVIGAGSVTLPAGQVAYFNGNIPFTTTGTTTSGSTTVTSLAYEIGIAAGNYIIGPGIPSGTQVLAINGASATLSQAATATASNVSLTFRNQAALTVQAANIASLSPNPNTVLFARSTGANVYVGVNSGQFVLRDNETKLLQEGGFLSIFAGTAGMALTARQPVYISPGPGDATVATIPSISSGVSYLYPSSINGLYAGEAVAGSGIAAGTTILSVGPSTSSTTGFIINLSANTTASGAAVPVTFTRVAGALYLTDASQNNGAVRSQTVGLVQTSAMLGAACNVVLAGAFSNFTGLVPGALYYVDPATPGGLIPTRTTILSAFVVPVGTALNTTTLFVNPSGAAANSVVTSINAWPQYGASTESQFASAVASVNASGGGIIVINGSFSINQTYTIGAGVVLQGRKSAHVVTVNAGGIVMAGDGSEIRDASFSLSAAIACVSVQGNFCILRGNRFAMPSAIAGTSVLVNGNATRIRDNIFTGVSSYNSVGTGINYASGADNSDDSSVFLS